MSGAEMLKDMPRGVSTRQADEDKPPNEKWADPAILARSPAFQFGAGKIFVGVLGGTVDRDRQTGERFVTGGQPVGFGDDRHIVLVAGSRAGKGRSVLIPTLLEYQGPVLALDPKGELAKITARRRHELGQRVCIVDPFHIVKSGSLQRFRVGFNPLMILRKDSPTLIEDAGLIADAMVPREGQDPHWDDSARTLIEGLILHVATADGYEGRRTLQTVRSLLMKGTTYEGDDGAFYGMQGLEHEMTANASALDAAGFERVAEVLDGAVCDYFERPENERGGVVSTARRHTKFLDYPAIQDSLSSHGFDLTELKTEPGGLTVYLCLPQGRMGTCYRWFRLFVNLALDAMEREETKPKYPVLAVLEEFHVLGHMRQLEIAAGLVAGFGMKLLIVLQDLTQIKRHYKDGWETFLGNAGLMMFFGNSDVTTLEFISKRCGQTSLIVDRGSDVRTKERLAGATGRSWSLEVKDLITAGEASRYFGRNDRQQRALVIATGDPPMIVQRVKYDRHELFRGKWDPA